VPGQFVLAESILICHSQLLVCRDQECTHVTECYFTDVLPTHEYINSIQ